MRPWGITTKPCIGSKEPTKNDLIRAFYCALDSILSARTRALKSLGAALACPSEIPHNSQGLLILRRSQRGGWLRLRGRRMPGGDCSTATLIRTARLLGRHCASLRRPPHQPVPYLLPEPPACKRFGLRAGRR